MDNEQGLPDPYTFCNCGRGGCPGISTEKTTGNVVISEDREQMVDRITERPGIVFDRAQARELFRWLKDHGYGE